ncbi:hypothetical protein BJV78DRAFT_204835 [Lactifluus subvellereus]|nr:hypothetical protein BJV78DRAFT_204835 [Lactifluus subvellereus]
MNIKLKAQRIVTVSFTPRREGLCGAVLELTFYDRKRKADFIVERTLRGVVSPLPIRDWADDNESLSSDGGEELLGSSGTGISVSGEDGFDFGIVERMHLDGPFAVSRSSLTIKNAEGFPAVTLVEARIRILFGSDSSFIATGDTHLIQPGTENTVYIQFNPEFEGVFEATLELIFYDSQRSARFVISKELHGIAGSLDDHRHFDSLDQLPARRPEGGRPEPPWKRILHSVPSQRRKSRKIPEYELPPIVQAAVDKITKRPYDMRVPGLIEALRPPDLNMDTYAQYFKALVNVEDGHQQYVQYLFTLVLTVMSGQARCSRPTSL